MASWLRVGNIRGPQGPVGPPGPQGPPGAAGEGFTGEIRAVIFTTPPAGWLMLLGQTIANGQTLWPNLWAICPASWRSGTNLVLPNLGDRVLMGATAGNIVGTLGGANTRTIPVGALPPHTHTMPHTHEHSHNHTIAHTHTIAHVHSMAHNHPAGTTSTAAAHEHAVAHNTWMQFGSGSLGMDAGGSGQPSNLMPPTSVMSPAGAHSHTFDVATFSGNTGAASAANTGAASATSSGLPNEATTGGASLATTTSTGTGGTMDMTPAHMRINFMIRAA